jgi:hypothetical protein
MTVVEPTVPDSAAEAVESIWHAATQVPLTGATKARLRSGPYFTALKQYPERLLRAAAWEAGLRREREPWGKPQLARWLVFCDMASQCE